jgi:hypothetical protein
MIHAQRKHPTLQMNNRPHETRNCFSRLPDDLRIILFCQTLEKAVDNVTSPSSRAHVAREVLRPVRIERVCFPPGNGFDIRGRELAPVGGVLKKKSIRGSLSVC